ncbi:hypothetical protein B0H14DRAFT_3480913 [Mycena olivaceomarginata]|nr:hypothetical protein B0H14DRAFT_3480913 [Mycena olivaceomarginata]
MCDTSDALQSSVLFWMLSLIPAKMFPYLSLGILSASSVVYALRRRCPAVTLDRLDNTITAVEEILTHAKAKCMRDYLALFEAETRFLRTKLAVSRLHSRLLEARHMPGWKTYLRDIFTISRALVMLEREVRDIQTSLLVLIEAAHQHKLTEDIRESQEIVDGVLQPYYSGDHCSRRALLIQDFDIPSSPEHSQWKLFTSARLLPVPDINNHSGGEGKGNDFAGMSLIGINTLVCDHEDVLGGLDISVRSWVVIDQKGLETSLTFWSLFPKLLAHSRTQLRGQSVMV